MSEFLAMLLIWTAQQSAVPPPVGQTEANCTAPVYASDRLICTDLELLGDERRIAALAQRFDGSGAAWLEPQTDWFRRRAMCAFQQRHQTCISEANAERLVVLTAADETPSEAGQRMRCAGASSAHDLIFVQRGDWLIAYDGGRLRWVAGRKRGTWPPYVSWTRGRSWTLQKLDGDRLECRLAT